LIRRQLDFRAALCHNQRVNRRGFGFAMELQVESILEQGSQHQPQLLGVRFGVFGLPVHIKTVGANPAWPSRYLELLNPVCEGD
jgi:hypothetical protein